MNTAVAKLYELFTGKKLLNKPIKRTVIYNDISSIKLDNQVGKVEFFESDSENTIIHISEYNYIDKSLVDIKYHNNELELKAESTNLFLNKTKTDFKIYTGKNTSLSITNNMGTISVKDINGSIKVRSNIGKVNVRSVSSSIDLKTNIGQINCTYNGIETEGMISAKANTGKITIKLNEMLNISSKLYTNVGKIYSDFSSNFKSNFQVLARTNTGKINLEKIVS